MPVVSPDPAEQKAAPAKAKEKEQKQEDTSWLELEGVTSEQVKHAQEESRAEGDPFEYPE
jgi:hypothetical protein